MGEPDVGIDLHRRRSVIVPMTGEGAVLERVRVDNDPVALSLELAKAGPDPRWSWRPPMVGTGPLICCRPAGPGCTWRTRWGQDVRLPAGPRPTPATPGTWPSCWAWVGSPSPGWLRLRCGSCASWSATGPSWWRCVAAAKPRSMPCSPSRGAVPMSDLFGVGGTGCWTSCSWDGPMACGSPRYAASSPPTTRRSRCWAGALHGSGRRRRLPGPPDHPRVTPVLAAVLVAEIGEVHRFAGAPPLCSWAGLTPRHRESDTSVRRGPITKQGPRLVRWAAVEATQRLPGASKQAAWFQRIADRRGTSRRPRRRRPPAADPGLLRPARRPGALPGVGAKAGDVNGSGAAGRVLVGVMTPPGGVVAPLIEPARLRPHSSMPPCAANR
jgi:hypothetical protein